MSTVQCNHPAVTAAMWCNKRLVLCDRCYRHAVSIAGALGFGLLTDDLHDDETLCTQKVRPEKAAILATDGKGKHEPVL